MLGSLKEADDAVQEASRRLEFSPAGASRHLLALHDAGLVAAERHGHEIRYARTNLGAALLVGRLRRSA